MELTGGAGLVCLAGWGDTLRTVGGEGGLLGVGLLVDCTGAVVCLAALGLPKLRLGRGGITPFEFETFPGAGLGDLTGPPTTVFFTIGGELAVLCWVLP